MAEHVIQTRILLRYDTYSNWMNSNTILKLGEAAIAAFPSSRTIAVSNIQPENTPPAIGIKIGDGVHYFHELPWVQGVAADVFNWAKQATKPTYTASEIQGLKAFIDENIPGGGDYTIAPRLYQLVEGTGDDENKYYLQYRESGDENWTLDANHYIDLTDLENVLTWIYKANLTNYPSLANFTRAQVSLMLGNLNVTDTARTDYFVTSVSESGGIVSTTKAQPQFSNIAGTATVSQGGTGVTTLPQDQVLIGNGTNPVRGRAIATEIDTTTDLVPNYLIKAYVDNAVEGLTGAMHFIGEAAVVINNGSGVDPRIGGYVFAQAQPGDVILSDAKEFVWTGASWRLLGDEGSYAVKGSIKDADIAADAAISQSKIALLGTTLQGKVDKVEGKDLSTNDYTNEDKSKLEHIEAGAQRNTIEHIFLNDVQILPTTKDGEANSIDLQISEFDQESRTKLAGIATGAQVNSIEHIYFDGTEVAADENKVVSITSNPHTDHINKIESISINGTIYPPDQNKQVSIVIDQAALNLNVIEGAIVPNGASTEDVEITQTKKLQLARIAKTGNVENLLQTNDTYIVLDCGTSTTVI